MHDSFWVGRKGTGTGQIGGPISSPLRQHRSFNSGEGRPPPSPRLRRDASVPSQIGFVCGFVAPFENEFEFEEEDDFSGFPCPIAGEALGPPRGNKKDRSNLGGSFNSLGRTRNSELRTSFEDEHDAAVATLWPALAKYEEHRGSPRRRTSASSVESPCEVGTRTSTIGGVLLRTVNGEP
jgi:hypothetical protein